MGGRVWGPGRGLPELGAVVARRSYGVAGADDWDYEKKEDYGMKGFQVVSTNGGDSEVGLLSRLRSCRFS